MGGKKSEACGRCSMTTVVGATNQDDEEGGGRNPFDGARIEVPEDEMRLVAAPAVALGYVKRRLNEFANRVTYGR